MTDSISWAVTDKPGRFRRQNASRRGGIAHDVRALGFRERLQRCHPDPRAPCRVGLSVDSAGVSVGRASVAHPVSDPGQMLTRVRFWSSVDP